MSRAFICLATLSMACVVVSLAQSTEGQQSNAQRDCTGLHAGITAQRTQQYTDPSVFVGFVLLNDSNLAKNTAPGSWKIVIDGKELADSDFIFGNGAQPSGGYDSLAPGAKFDFGYALSISRYFPEAREYQISWRGRDFQSPTVVLNIAASTATH